mgnify:CR=1 FL=1
MVVDVVGPSAALDEVIWVDATVFLVLVFRDGPVVTVARPDPPAVSNPPECEADWYVVYGA